MTYVSPFLDSNSLKENYYVEAAEKRVAIGEIQFMMKDFESAQLKRKALEPSPPQTKRSLLAL